MHILNRNQLENGFFPTFGIKGDKHRIIENIYLHTYVLEYLLKNYPTERTTIQKGLDFLLTQAVEEDGRKVWQWLKKPQTKEEYHPADTDDTIRARLIIEKAKQKGFLISQEFQSFDYERTLRALQTSKGGILTYLGSHPQNVCPEVNANILHALTEIKVGADITEGLRAYMRNIIDSDYLTREKFKERSKYFISPFFLLYTLSQIDEKSRGVSNEQLLSLTQRNEPEDKLEKAWYYKILDNIRIPTGSYVLPSEDLIPIFQARSLGETYGSPSATFSFSS